MKGNVKGGREGEIELFSFLVVQTNMILLNVQTSIMHMCVCMLKVYTLSFRLKSHIN